MRVTKITIRSPRNIEGHIAMALFETKLCVHTTPLLAYFDSAVLTCQKQCHWYNMFGLQRADITTVMTD